jgi:chemotaxis protein CheC
MRGIRDDEETLDRLRELANVGAGHAADALAQLVGCPIWMSVPRLAAGWRTARALRGATGILFEVEGAAGSAFAVVLPPPARAALLECLLGDPEAPAPRSAEALCEVGNILASRALSAIADLAGGRLLPSIPTLAEGEALMKLVARRDADGGVRIETELLDARGAVRGVLSWAPPAQPSARRESV